MHVFQNIYKVLKKTNNNNSMWKKVQLTKAKDSHDTQHEQRRVITSNYCLIYEGWINDVDTRNVTLKIEVTFCRALAGEPKKVTFQFFTHSSTRYLWF